MMHYAYGTVENLFGGQLHQSIPYHPAVLEKKVRFSSIQFTGATCTSTLQLLHTAKKYSPVILINKATFDEGYKRTCRQVINMIPLASLLPPAKHGHT
jgi:hypothetical protein